MQSANQTIDSSEDHGISIVAAAVSLIRRNAGAQRANPRLSSAARACLVAKAWGPDLDGLEDCIARALVLCNGDTVEPRHLALTPAGLLVGQARETDVILASLRAADGRRREAAASLGIAPRTLRMKLAALRTRGFAVPAARAPISHDLCQSRVMRMAP